jgi:glycine/D-amino acid oxidase-like deaminating enzyme
METYDVVIVGAGIVGAACAYELTGADLKVAIIDESEPGSGATNAGMGHVLVMGDSDAQFAFTRYSLELWREIATSLPPECGYWECGTIWVAGDEADLRLAEGKSNYYSENGVKCELLDESQIADAEPNLRPGILGGLLISEDAAIRPRSAVDFLLDSALQRGACLVSGRSVVKLNDSGARLSDGDTASAGAYINATGTSASVLTRGLPIRSRKGHILVAGAGPNFARHQVVELGYLKSVHEAEIDSVAFNVRQRTSDELLVGSSRQYDVEEADVDPAILDRMLSRAIEYMPALANARRITSWAGFRAGTPDELPLIGRCPGFERIYAATGHEGLGVTTSLATARLLRQEILAEPPVLDPRPYNPARFSDEEAKQR